ncbi:MAG: hypothetical protein ACRDLB_10455 [Actinomycetota bacterium]
MGAYDLMTWGAVVIGALVVVGLIVAVRSSSKWRDTSPTDPAARQALYRLWSKRGSGER